MINDMGKVSEKKDLIKREDFHSYEIETSIKNLTTNTEIKSGQRFYGKTLDTHIDPMLHIDFIELQEKGMVLEVPDRTCSQGHNVFIKLHVNALEKGELTFAASAKVKKSERIKKSKRNRITIELIQFDSNSWNQLQALFAARQNEIEEFFASVKGY